MQFPDFVFETLPEDPSSCDCHVPYIEYYPTKRNTSTTSNNTSTTNINHNSRLGNNNYNNSIHSSSADYRSSNNNHRQHNSNSRIASRSTGGLFSDTRNHNNHHIIDATSNNDNIRASSLSIWDHIAATDYDHDQIDNDDESIDPYGDHSDSHNIDNDNEFDPYRQPRSSNRGSINNNNNNHSSNRRINSNSGGNIGNRQPQFSNNNYNMDDKTNTNSNNSGGRYLYRCLLCQRNDLCELGIQFHCNEPFHLERVMQLKKDKEMAKHLLDRWYRTGIIVGNHNNNNNNNTHGNNYHHTNRSGMNNNSNNSNNHNITNNTNRYRKNNNTNNNKNNFSIDMIKNTLQYRIEHNIGLPAWKYHIQSLLYRYMTTPTSSDHTATNNAAFDHNNNNSNNTDRTSFYRHEYENESSIQYLEEAYSLLKQYEYLERISLLELAIWKASCIVEMKPIIIIPQHNNIHHENLYRKMIVPCSNNDNKSDKTNGDSFQDTTDKDLKEDVDDNDHRHDNDQKQPGNNKSHKYDSSSNNINNMMHRPNHHNSNNLPFAMDYFSMMDWTANGWKCNKVYMRKTNAIAIIIEHVIPFLEIIPPLPPNYYNTTTTTATTTRHHHHNINTSDGSGTGSVRASFCNNTTTSYDMNHDDYESSILKMVRTTQRPRPWASTSLSSSALLLSTAAATTTTNGGSSPSLSSFVIRQHQQQRNSHDSNNSRDHTTTTNNNKTSRLATTSATTGISNSNNANTNDSSSNNRNQHLSNNNPFASSSAWLTQSGNIPRSSSARVSRSNLKPNITVYNFNDSSI